MRLTYYVVDVFTSDLFGGNPLAVFPDADRLSSPLMQKIANEMNLSETTFILAPENEENDCKVRIFTPKQELPMAGHPTIGTAYVILKNRLLQPKRKSSLIFEEGVGDIRIHYDGTAEKPGNIFMEQPQPQFGEVFPEKEKIAQLLSLQETDIRADLPIQDVSCGVPYLLIPLTSLSAARRAKVRLDLMEATLEGRAARQLLIFTEETENAGFTAHTRMFAPMLGIAEDPATGSAHGPLGSYLVKYGISDGKGIVNEQGYEIGRRSTIRVEVKTEARVYKVRVGGGCVAVAEGSMRI